MSRDLLLTLGHNSSAILIDDNVIVGYENERLTGIKSDSRFPYEAIDALGVRKFDRVYASHWAPTGTLADLPEKYWKPTFFNGQPIYTLSPDFTHHDAHLWAALSFAGPNFPIERTYIFVIDGFGNFGEHFSVYELMAYRTPRLVARYRGYDTSLGLLYQYATAFMGMKMHEDEYKLLGYEVHLEEIDVSGGLRPKLNKLADQWAEEWFAKVSASGSFGDKYDPIYDLNALPNTRKLIFERLSKVLDATGIADPASYNGRVALAYYTQRCLEEAVSHVLNAYKPHNLIVSGGCFYNVKLNKILIDEIEGKFCAYPLAGDQGNALGLYAVHNPTFRFPYNLNWGVRELSASFGSIPGLHYLPAKEGFTLAAELIKTYGYVNLVRGAMEFGPRALCNTSTLARPTMEVVQKINKANDRNTVMPMAPVVTLEAYEHYFKRTQHVWKSEYYMITALEYKENFEAEQRAGAAHKYDDGIMTYYTGRPQVTEDEAMIRLLNQFGGMLINTSFNYHGHPIVCGMREVARSHFLQRQQDGSFQTIVITE